MAEGGQDIIVGITGGAGGDNTQLTLVRYNNPILVIKHPEKGIDIKVCTQQVFTHAIFFILNSLAGRFHNKKKMVDHQPTRLQTHEKKPKMC